MVFLLRSFKLFLAIAYFFAQIFNFNYFQTIFTISKMVHSTVSTHQNSPTAIDSKPSSSNSNGMVSFLKFRLLVVSLVTSPYSTSSDSTQTLIRTSTTSVTLFKQAILGWSQSRTLAKASEHKHEFRSRRPAKRKYSKWKQSDE